MANVLIETWPRAAIERAAAGQAAAGGSSQADGSRTGDNGACGSRVAGEEGKRKRPHVEG